MTDDARELTAMDLLFRTYRLQDRTLVFLSVENILMRRTHT